MAFQNKRKFCYFKENGITEIDYKDVKFYAVLLMIKVKLCLEELLEQVLRCIESWFELLSDLGQLH